MVLAPCVCQGFPAQNNQYEGYLIMALICWISEFILEAFGAYRAHKRKFFPLAWFLGFRAFSDFICAMVLSSSGPSFYAWAWYIQAVIQYVLFAVAIVWIAAKLLREDKETLKFYSGVFAGFSILAVAFFHVRPLTMPNILHFAAATYFFFGILICLALFMRQSERFDWYGIAALILSASNGLLSAMQAEHWNVTGYYPIGEIVALSLWAWELRSRARWEFRFSVTRKARG